MSTVFACESCGGVLPPPDEVAGPSADSGQGIRAHRATAPGAAAVARAAEPPAVDLSSPR
jgi:hypothetical protein